MRRVRLRTLLVVLVLVTTLPIAAFAAWVVWRSWAQHAAVIDAQNIEQARAILVAVDQEIEATFASLNVLMLLDPIDAPDKQQFEQIASRVLPLHPGWQSIQLIDPSLQVLASTSGTSSDALAPDPEWVHEVIASGRPSISGVMRDPASGQAVVSLGVPVRRGGRLKYVLGARVYARMFGDILQRQKTPADGVAVLMDHKLVIAARTRNEGRYVGEPALPEFQARSARTPEGSWRTIMREGIPAYSAWSRSPLTHWTVGIALPAAAIDEPVRRSFIALVAGGLGVSGIGLILAVLLGRRLIRAQTAATRTAAAVARGEPIALFHSRIAEVHDLAQGLREAAAILETRLHERDRAQADADRHKAALLERETSARRTAEALSRAKDEFIATVSHELRTPLNAIYGWLAMLRSGALDPAGQARAFEVIDRNTRAQAQLVEDLLDMSRAIEGNIRLAMEPVDLAVVLDATIESLRPTAEARRLTIEAAAPRNVAIVSGDSRRLQQVLWNILSNAIKFTPPGGRITVAVRADGADALIRVSDSGEGITPEFLPHVFDRFRQENATVTRSHSGLGLGLSLVRHLVELHGGAIAAESGGKGQGATFSLRLPLLANAAAHLVPAPPPHHAPGDRDRLRDRRVLVVDDDQDARDLAAAALSQSGALVTRASSAADAMAAIDAETPEAIVADIGMPLMSGYELAERLRRDPRMAAVSLVALTAYGGADARDAALAAGFHAYMRKPYEPGALTALVANVLAARAINRSSGSASSSG
jgi:signal transduction histidine kinase/ActR/RegA family two-component response regulator